MMVDCTLGFASTISKQVEEIKPRLKAKTSKYLKYDIHLGQLCKWNDWNISDFGFVSSGQTQSSDLRSKDHVEQVAGAVSASSTLKLFLVLTF